MIDGLFRRRRNAYRRLFRTEAGDPVGDARAVLADLKRFAHLPDAPVRGANGQTDPILTGIMIGRQEAVNRILAHVHIDEAAFLNLRENTDD
jgi:hypothetical protein